MNADRQSQRRPHPPDLPADRLCMSVAHADSTVWNAYIRIWVPTIKVVPGTG